MWMTTMANSSLLPKPYYYHNFHYQHLRCFKINLPKWTTSTRASSAAPGVDLNTLEFAISKVLVQHQMSIMIFTIRGNKHLLCLLIVRYQLNNVIEHYNRLKLRTIEIRIEFQLDSLALYLCPYENIAPSSVTRQFTVCVFRLALAKLILNQIYFAN